MTWHDYAVEILRIFHEADIRQDLLWHPNNLEFRSFPIVFSADCSDIFGYAWADSEDINREDLELLLDCYTDLKEAGGTEYLAALYASRKRNRRPASFYMRRLNHVHERAIFNLFPPTAEGQTAV